MVSCTTKGVHFSFDLGTPYLALHASCVTLQLSRRHPREHCLGKVRIKPYPRRQNALSIGVSILDEIAETVFILELQSMEAAN
jgi:hypothetical protein